MLPVLFDGSSACTIVAWVYPNDTTRAWQWIFGDMNGGLVDIGIIEKIDFFQNDIVGVAPEHFAAGSAAGVYSSDAPRIRRHSSGIALSVHSRGAGPVRMSLYDMQGRCVAVLYDGAPQGSSFDVIVRNGVVSHGVYVLRTVIDGRKAIARFVVN